MDWPLLFGRRDSARTLGISLRKLDSLVAEGSLRPRRIGRRVLFERQELERFSRRDHITLAAKETRQ